MNNEGILYVLGEPKGDWKDSWRAMEQAVRDGKIRSLGFSNIYHDEIYELLNWSVEPVSVIQNWFDPLNQDRDTREICAEYNIRYMGFSTLGNSWLIGGLFEFWIFLCSNFFSLLRLV